jgi:hypothetical protein
MGRENTIRTGTNAPSRLLGIPTTNHTIHSLNPTHLSQYGVVKDVNPTTRDISYYPIANNALSSKTGIAKCKSTNTIQLPKPGYIVHIIIGPTTDISVPNSSGNQTVYYDPSHVGIWKTIDDNKIELSSEQSKKTPVINVDKSDIKQSQIGIPHNTTRK